MAMLTLVILIAVVLFLLGLDGGQKGTKGASIQHFVSGSILIIFAILVWDNEFMTVPRWIVATLSVLFALMGALQIFFIWMPPLSRGKINPRTGKEEEKTTK